MRGTRATIAVALAAGCTFAGAAVGAPANPHRQAGGATLHLTKRAAASPSYWTAARMRQATVLDLVKPPSRRRRTAGGVHGLRAPSFVLSVNSSCPGILTCIGSSTLFGPYFGGVARDLYRQSRGRLARCSGKPVTQLGTTGSDSFTGGPLRDSIGLGAGSDAGAGVAGDDRLCGGSGDDTLRGGTGFDVCDGGPGTDTASGCEVRRRIP